MKFGRFDISLINFGSFRLDGGAMFGSVPKNLWAKRMPADSDNCIQLATRSLLIREGSRVFLVDVGLGTKWPEKSVAIFDIKNVDPDPTLFKPSEVSDIILTHLHFDHAGGISRFKSGNGGELELCYPQAKMYLQEDNWRNAKNPSPKEKASYLKENILPIERGILKLIKGTTELYPDIWVHQVDGHTIGQQWVEVRGTAQSIVFPTDLIPTSHHLPVPFHMGYDACASTLLNEKEKFLAEAVAENWIVVFQHDPEIAAARIGRDERGQFCLREKVEIN